MRYRYIKDYQSLIKMKAYVINLPERTDRWERFLTTWRDCDLLHFTRVDGIKDDQGWLGLIKTQKRIIQKAKENNEPFVLIMEDDATMEDDFSERFSKIQEWLQNNQWDLFYGGVTFPTFKEYLNKELCLFRGSFLTAHFLMIKNTVYDDYLSWDNVDIPCDVWFCNMSMNKYIAVGTLPMLSKQMCSYSDIQNTNVDYNSFFSDAESKLMFEISK